VTFTRRGPLARVKAGDLAILVAIMAVGLVAFLLTWQLNAGLPRERQTRDTLEHIRVDAAQLEALEWRLIAARKVEARDTLASELTLDDMVALAAYAASLQP